MKKTLRSAIAQINPVVGDIGGNLKCIRKFLLRAKARQCDLVIFPEMAITGYPPEDLLFKKHFIASNRRALKQLCSSVTNICAITGFVDQDKQGRLYNAAAILKDKKIVAVYRKICLPNYGVFDERRYFAAGEKPLLLKTPAGLIAVSICEDIWPENSAYLQNLKGHAIQILINLSASPYYFGKQKEREAMLRSRALRLHSYVAYANTVGGQDELVFDGGSLFLDPRGNRLASALSFKEDLLMQDIPAQKGKGRHYDYKEGQKRRLILKEIALEGKPEGVRKSLEHRPDRRPSDTVEEIYQALSLGTHDYVVKNKFQRVLVAISGGIDSALVATIAADTLGKENVILVTMPSRFSSPQTKEDAKRLALNLGLKCIEIPIEPLRRAYLKALSAHFIKHKPDETEENLQARIRGNILMALSNKFKYLVLTTGNKSELATGYCTLYGDMVGGFSVLKDVPKTIVYKLCRYRNTLAKQPVIPESIIRRAPSAELRPGQKDTDTLPPYELLDPILHWYVENDASPDQIARKGFPRKTVKSMIRRVDQNEYKRRQGPIGVKITPKSFGRDRRMPITNLFS